MDILIVGCGIAGPVLASFLLCTGEQHRITMIERSAALRTAGQNVDIRGAGCNVLQKLDMLETVKANTTQETGVLWVNKYNKVFGRFAADPTGKVQTGTSDIEILRGRLAELMYQRSREISDETVKQGGHGIEFVFGDSITSIEESERVTVKYKSERTGVFDLVVGADGLQSTVRRTVFGDFKHPLNMYGGFFSMPSGPTDSKWRRWFHAPGRRGIMVRPSHDNARTTVFMAVLGDKSLSRSTPQSQKELMASSFHGTGWESERVIQEMYAADDFYFDEIAQVRIDKWSKGRVVLLADAGYCASPLSGMGTTLALTGAYNLAGALASEKSLPAAFEKYEEAMRPTVARAQKLVPGMPWIFHPETAWGLWIMETMIFMLSISRIGYVLAMLLGPPANAVPIADYGISDWKEVKDSILQKGK